MAARSSIRGGGWVPSGWASPWECRAAQSRQARPEKAQGPSLGASTMLRCGGGGGGFESDEARTLHAPRQRPFFGSIVISTVAGPHGAKSAATFVRGGVRVRAR
eukprot:scaffold23210_cov45-Phaeocystis_antarctica.AAC.1